MILQAAGCGEKYLFELEEVEFLNLQNLITRSLLKMTSLLRYVILDPYLTGV